MRPPACTAIRAARRPARRAGRLGVLLLCAALAGAACGGADGIRGDRAALAATVDSLVAEYRDVTHAPGVSVSVVRGGRDTLVLGGYGYANVEHDVPATPETVYRIGSISKQFTAAAVLRLAEQGRLSLDDSIRTHLPLLPPAWSGIRVRHLLNHTSGIPNVPPQLYQGGLSEAALTPDSVIGLVRRGPLEFAPGTAWQYGNVGYTVLGKLIERLTGEPYAQHLESSLLRPLGLRATRYCHVAPVIRNRAAGYDQRDTGVVNASHISMTFVYAAGGLCSTVGDMAAWNHALATGRVVSAESWTRMTTPEPGAEANGYGYGLFMDTIAGRRMIQHDGGIHGFQAINAYLPDDSLSVSVLTNLGAPGPEPLLHDIIRAALAATPAGRARATAAVRD